MAVGSHWVIPGSLFYFSFGHCRFQSSSLFLILNWKKSVPSALVWRRKQGRWNGTTASPPLHLWCPWGSFDRFRKSNSPSQVKVICLLSLVLVALLILVKLGSQSRVHCDHCRLIGICGSPVPRKQAWPQPFFLLLQSYCIRTGGFFALWELE